MAAVQEFKATVALFPQYSVSLLSNNLVRGPVVIHQLLRAAVTSSMTLWSIRGGENGIIYYLVYMVNQWMYTWMAN